VQVLLSRGAREMLAFMLRRRAFEAGGVLLAYVLFVRVRG